MKRETLSPTCPTISLSEDLRPPHTAITIANMTFQQILHTYRTLAFSERDKGDRFERFQESAVIDKPAVDSFLSTSSREFKDENYPPGRRFGFHPRPPAQHHQRECTDGRYAPRTRAATPAAP